MKKHNTIKTSFTEAFVIVNATDRDSNSFSFQHLVLLSLDGTLSYTAYHATLPDHIAEANGGHDHEVGTVIVVTTPVLDIRTPVSLPDRSLAVQLALTTKSGLLGVSWLTPPPPDVFEAFKKTFPNSFGDAAKKQIEAQRKRSKAKSGEPDLPDLPDGFDYSRN